MNNSHLSKRVDRAKGDFENIIDELISEIEELESDKNILTDEIVKLKEEIEELRSPD
jgi:peptidoglycan hydrolase CwlO-like protein